MAGLAEVAGENAEMVVWEGAGENAGWEVAGENADLEDPDPKPSPKRKIVEMSTFCLLNKITQCYQTYYPEDF